MILYFAWRLRKVAFFLPEEKLWKVSSKKWDRWWKNTLVPSRPVSWPARLGGAEWTLSWKKVCGGGGGCSLGPGFRLQQAPYLGCRSQLLPSPATGTMDKQESRCPRPGPLRLFVLTCLLVSAPQTVLAWRYFSLHCSCGFELWAACGRRIEILGSPQCPGSCLVSQGYQPPFMSALWGKWGCLLRGQDTWECLGHSLLSPLLGSLAVALTIVLSCPFLGLLSHFRNAPGSNVRRTANGGEDRTGGEAQAQGSLHPGVLIWGGDCSPSLDIISSFAETAVNLLTIFVCFVKFWICSQENIETECCVDVKVSTNSFKVGWLTG